MAPLQTMKRQKRKARSKLWYRKKKPAAVRAAPTVPAVPRSGGQLVKATNRTRACAQYSREQRARMLVESQGQTLIVFDEDEIVDKAADQPFRFCDLPKEIRTIIFHELLLPAGPELEFDMHNTGDEQDDTSSDPRDSRRIWTTILRASRQLHIEGCAVLYGQSRLIFIPASESTSGDSLSIEVAHATSTAFRKFLGHYNHLITHIDLAYVGCIASGIDDVAKCKNLRVLKLGLTQEFYQAAQGTGERCYRIEETPGIRELLRIRGLTRLEIHHKFNLEDRHDLRSVQTKCDALLQRMLLKTKKCHGY